MGQTTVLELAFTLVERVFWSTKLYTIAWWFLFYFVIQVIFEGLLPKLKKFLFGSRPTTIPWNIQHKTFANQSLINLYLKNVEELIQELIIERKLWMKK